MPAGDRIERRGESVRLRLSTEERELLAHLLGELRARLGTESGSPNLRRLFPPAYDRDEEREPAYRQLVGGELVAGRLRDVEVVERTLASRSLADDELEAWLRALNDLRLVLGTRLNVTEELYERAPDPDDPDTPELALYAYLTWLQEQAVEASRI
jgi:hypothetical protein